MQPQSICPVCGAQFTPKRACGKPQKYCGEKCRGVAKRPPAKNQTLEERFWKYVDASGGSDACWPWQGGTTEGGYGLFFYNRHGVRNTTANKVAFELSTGETLGPDEKACHSCDIPPCCNPRHIFRGTQAENLADASRKKRLVGNRGQLKGERNASAKLTEEQVLDIRQRCARGEKQIDIARRYGIADSLVSLIHTRHLWRHLS